jgi:dTDP-glucose pyrophosphorylase
MKRKGIILAGGSRTRFRPLILTVRHTALFARRQILNQLAVGVQT